MARKEQQVTRKQVTQAEQVTEEAEKIKRRYGPKALVNSTVVLDINGRPRRKYVVYIGGGLPI